MNWVTGGARYNALYSRNLFNEINGLCKEKFGYPVEFITFPEYKIKNEYLTSLQAGLEYDLIFPTKACDIEKIEDFKPLFYWNDNFFDLYMDVSSYLGTYCTDVYNHMRKFDDVVEMVTRQEKISIDKV